MLSQRKLSALLSSPNSDLTLTSIWCALLERGWTRQFSKALLPKIKTISSRLSKRVSLQSRLKETTLFSDLKMSEMIKKVLLISGSVST